MKWLKATRLWFRKKEQQTSGDLSDELRFHLEKEIELTIARGMSPEEARRQALIAFGGVDQTRERVREVHWTHWLEILASDLRYGWRLLRKSPGVTTIAVLTLALGIGLNTAIFSIIDAVLFRMLPADHPEQLVLLRWHAHHRPAIHGHSSWGYCAESGSFNDTNPSGCTFSLPFANAVRSDGGIFSGLAVFAGGPRIDLSGNGAASIVNHPQVVSGDFFETLGVRPAAGRLLGPLDDVSGAAPVIVLSYGYWQSAFGGSPDTIGKVVKLNGITATIVGVAEPRFTGLIPGTQYDIWLPVSLRPRVKARWTPDEEDEGSWWLAIVGRSKPGVSSDQAQAALTLLLRDQTLHLAKPSFALSDDPGIQLVPAQKGLEGQTGQLLQPLYVLMLAVALVLLIACANVAGLLLARAAGRSREIAVRLVLGAKRARLISQLLVESVLLSALGGALGLLFAKWGARGLMLLTQDPESGPLPFYPTLDWRVLGFTAVTAVLTGIIFGLVPALRSLSVDLTPALKSESASAAARSSSKWFSLGNALVIAQVSLAVVALVTAGLLVRSLNNLMNVNPGFDTRNVLVFGLDPSLAGYKGQQVETLFRDLQEQIASLPGVLSASYSQNPLLSGGRRSEWVHLPGMPKDDFVDVDYMAVGPDFFSTMRIPFDTGRDFSVSDFAEAARVNALPPDAPPDPKSPPVPAIVNQAFVRRFLPDKDPLGRHLDESAPKDRSQEFGPGYTIVGVVGDTKYNNLRRDMSPTMYVPHVGAAYFSVRTAANPLALLSSVRDLITRRDSNLAMFHASTQEQRIDELMIADHLVARASTGFGLLAVALACIGLYGLLVYEVTRRTREIGIRMAVGARRSNVVGMVVRHGLALASAGAIIGGAASLAVSGVLRSLLYKVKFGDPVTLAAVAGLLLLVALVACYVPARRATRVDPLEALRYE